jgi:hypothetical protein
METMNKCINFEDNLFVLNIRIRMLRDLLVLDVDPELFLKKTLDDMDFIDTVLGSLIATLNDTTHLMDRDELFHNLYETAQYLLDTLANTFNSQGTISSAEIPLFRDKVILLQEHTLERIQTLETSLSACEPVSTEPVVSSDEMNELLREF